MLSYLARATRRVKLGTSVLVIPYRHPLIDGEDAGHDRPARRAAASSWAPASAGCARSSRRWAPRRSRQRGRRDRRVPQADAPGVDGGPGRVRRPLLPRRRRARAAQAGAARGHPDLDRRPHGRGAPARARPIGDGWHPIGLRPPAMLLPDEYAAAVGRLHDHARKAGRDPASITLTLPRADGGPKLAREGARRRPSDVPGHGRGGRRRHAPLPGARRHATSSSIRCVPTCARRSRTSSASRRTCVPGCRAHRVRAPPHPRSDGPGPMTITHQDACAPHRRSDGGPGRAHRPRRRGARPRTRPQRDLLEEGVRAAHDALPRLLRVLHVPARSRRAGRAHDDAGRSRRARAGRRAARREGGAVLARRQARGALPGAPRVPRAARTPHDARRTSARCAR